MERGSIGSPLPTGTHMIEYPKFIPPAIEPDADCIRAMFKEKFTVQERLYVTDLLQRGHYDSVGAALNVEEPERNYWLDKYLCLKRPKLTVLESVVQKELAAWEAANGPIPTPEIAAFWDARLKAELAGEKLAPLDEALASIGVLTNEEKMDVSMTKAEICAALEAKGIEYDPASKKADLKALLES